MALKSDIEIAQEARPLPITAIAEACGVDEAYLEQYGRYKAKIDNRFLKETARPEGLTLVQIRYPDWEKSICAKSDPRETAANSGENCGKT